MISEHPERPSMEQGGSSSGGEPWPKRAAADLKDYIDKMYERIGLKNRRAMEMMIKSEGLIVKNEALLGEYNAYVKVCADWKGQYDSESQDVGPSMQQTETSFENMSRQEQMRYLVEDVLKRDGKITRDIRNGHGTAIEQHMYQSKVSKNDWEEFKAGEYYKGLYENERGLSQYIFRTDSIFRLKE